MKNGFLKVFCKYWFCILLNIVMVIGMSLSTRYTNLCVIGSDMVKLGLSSLYLIYVIPTYSLIYGSLSYTILKKVWSPQLILYTITVIGLFVNNLIFDREIDAWRNILVFSLGPVIFSLVGTLIAAFIYNIVKSIKENKSQKP